MSNLDMFLTLVFGVPCLILAVMIGIEYHKTTLRIERGAERILKQCEDDKRENGESRNAD